jgi:2-succinyl-6-hydroxy-2,4-cyclohexadiene-1-carboxylate synthase
VQRPLHVDIEGTGRAIVALHGFTQNSNCWGPFGVDLAAMGQVAFVDAPGHGRSQHDGADLWEAADLITESAGSGIYIGYSMGGRMALHVALAAQEMVEGLVLIGATAGLQTDEEREERVRADESLARSITIRGVDAFLEEWLALPLFSGLTHETAMMAARQTNRAVGLAASLRACGTGTQDDLWGRLVEITVPVLLLSGSEDRKFTDICAAMQPLFGGSATHLVVEGVGHSVHLEAPGETASLINGWMAHSLSL